MIQTSGSVGCGMSEPAGCSRWNIQASWVGPSAWLQAVLPTMGTSVLCMLRPVGLTAQLALSVALNFCAMKPSSPGSTLLWRLSCGRFRRTVVPSVPPGFSSAPTSTASTVRAQQHSKAPQPLLTDLPSITATGRSGSVTPSITVVAPTLAFSRYSLAMRRMLAAGTSHTPDAHSGEYFSICSTSLVKAVTPSTLPSSRTSSSASTLTAPLTLNLPDRAGTAPAVSKGTALPVSVSHSSGLRLAASRRKRPSGPTR